MRKAVNIVCAALMFIAASCGSDDTVTPFSNPCKEKPGVSAAGQMALFYEQSVWISQKKAEEIGEAILAGVETFEDPRAYNTGEIAEWVEQNTGDGDIDCLVLFGYLPETIYPPGNSQPDGSLVEKFIDDGNFVMNTGDYIFYVSKGGAVNGAEGLQNIADAKFHLWTDDNAVQPTREAELCVSSLGLFISNRSFSAGQIAQDKNWTLETAFGTGKLGYDPVILKHAVTGGRIGIWMQVYNDRLNRAEVALDIFNNWAGNALQSADSSEAP